MFMQAVMAFWQSSTFKTFPSLAAESKEWVVLSAVDHCKTVLGKHSILSHTISSFTTGFQ
jgi:hypothetical protein